MPKHTGPADADTPVAESTLALLSTAYPALLSFDKKKRSSLHEMLTRVALHRGVGTSLMFSSGLGLSGYTIHHIERTSPSTARLTFHHESAASVTTEVPCGPLPLVPLTALEEMHVSLTPRVRSLLTTMLQLHSIGRDIALVPSSLDNESRTQASSSKSTCIHLFGALLGYSVETIWLWKDVSGTELLMRRATTPDGATVWQPAPLTTAALRGSLVHLAGADVLGSTLESLSRLTQDREMELWEGTRLTTEADVPVSNQLVLSLIHI